MKAVMVMFDSLNRHFLSRYGCQWPSTPNFQRLAEKTLTFDTSFVCSMPCIPARRDLHTGRPSFLHRRWGPLEPFDVSVPETLKENGISSHLITDHYHYWEDGASTYHNRYSTYEFFRGQEGDLWKGLLGELPIPSHENPQDRRQNWINRSFMAENSEHCQTRTFDAACDFIDRNHEADNWFLQIESFDPHEPFFADQEYRSTDEDESDDPLFDWPNYGPVTESPEKIARGRRSYAALLRKCDQSLGRILDLMDGHNLWEDTMFIVWTDHGFLLGEHDLWGKNIMPLYREISNTPFFLWDPRCGKCNERRASLVQPAIDLGPTLLDFFSLPRPETMIGQNLAPVISQDDPVRKKAIFGHHGQDIHITDGNYIYIRAPIKANNAPLFNYTLMPMRPQAFFQDHMLRDAVLTKEFSFTRGLPVLRCPSDRFQKFTTGGPGQHLLWDLRNESSPDHAIRDPDLEEHFCRSMVRLMEECESPSEQYDRMGLGNFR